MKMARLIFSMLVLVFALVSCGDSPDRFSERGKYIYDDAGRLPLESKISLASYLLTLDSKTGYEAVLVFPKEQASEEAMLKWFNEMGVGKKKRDNGAAVFVFSDNSVFVAIGSGNDKISVSFSKTHGERIFTGFKDDPALTLLRFLNALGGRVDTASETEIGGAAFETLKNNFDVILLWAAAIALLLFTIQQFDGFQSHDIILPAAVFAVLGLFFGISAVASVMESETYKTYGIITETKRGSYTWVHMHTICTSSGKTTTCTSYPHVHTMYTNDVKLLSYEFKKYKYQFKTDQSKDAWRHDVGEVDALVVNIRNMALLYAHRIDDRSGGKTIGDGVWINAAKTKAVSK